MSRNVVKVIYYRNLFMTIIYDMTIGIRDEKEVKNLKKRNDLLSEKVRSLEMKNQKECADLDRIKHEKSELTKSLTRYQEWV